MARRRAEDRAAAWWGQTACLGHDTDAWYPERGQVSVGALLVCDACPVWQPCLDVGMGEEFGIWGRLRVSDRRRLRRLLRANPELDVYVEADRIAREVRARIEAELAGDGGDGSQLVLFGDDDEGGGGAGDLTLDTS